MSAQRIIVTGAGGFIGYNLANHFAGLGHQTVGIDLHFPDQPGPGREARFEKVHGDFRDEKLMDRLLGGGEIVFHLASAHLNVNLSDAEYWETNVHSLPKVLELARKKGVQRWVHYSSVGIYGRLAECPADEETACHPQSIYGQTKLAGEKAVRDYSHQSGFPVVILRPAWVYGPGCPRTLKLYRALKKRRFIIIGRGDNLRHPVYIRDLLAASESALNLDAAVGETFIIAGEKAVTSRELIEAFCRTLELPKPPFRLPYPIGRLLAFMCERVFGWIGKEPPISRRSLEFFDTDNEFAIDRARNQLGYQPVYALDQGLQETRSWLIAVTEGKPETQVLHESATHPSASRH